LTAEICPLSALVNYQSTTLFLLSHTLPNLHGLSTHALLPNRRLRLISPFGLREFQLSTLASAAVLPPEIDDLSMPVPHRSTTVVHFFSSGFGSFNSQCSFSPRVLSLEDNDLSTRVPHRSKAVVHFDSSGFGSLNSQSLSPCLQTSEVVDLAPHVPLDDGRSLASSRLRRILAPVCTQRLKARAPCPDPTTRNDPAPS
jgi:hypothetical protein